MDSLIDRVSTATQSVKKQFNERVESAVILGSGLSDLSLDGYDERAQIRYSNMDGMPHSTAPSHSGLLKVLAKNNQAVALCAGRQHLYEGYTAAEVAILIYVLRELGVKTIIVTNAAGALNPAYRPGDIMLITDHINFTGQNPLIGQDETFGTRFPDMSEAYSRKLTQHAIDASARHNLNCHTGVYLGVSGPSLETSAERRMFRSMGADAIGMSTVTEVIAANHCGMDVLGISAITNLALGDENQQPDSIEEVLRNAAIAGQGIATILNELFR